MSDVILFVFGSISAAMCAGAIGILIHAARKDGEADVRAVADAAKHEHLRAVSAR
jgi:GTPase